jgi:GT2 family glycosyltransferase
MTLGIAILNWNQSSDTIACVRLAQRWPIADKRIWVVDNGSRPDEVEALSAALAEVEVIYSPTNRGFAGGNNLALTRALEAGCRSVLLFNNDAQAEGDAIQHLQATLESHERVGIVGPVLMDAAAPGRLLAAGGRDIGRHLASHILDPLSPGALRPTDYVPGTCALIRSQVLCEVGLLDEAYFFGGELADLCARARAAGWHCVVNGSAIVHHAVDRSAAIRRDLHSYYVVRNRFLYARKFHGRRWLASFMRWTLYGVYAGATAIQRGNLSQARAIGLGCLDGWRGRFGGQNGRVTGGRIV